MRERRGACRYARTIRRAQSVPERQRQLRKLPLWLSLAVLKQPQPRRVDALATGLFPRHTQLTRCARVSRYAASAAELGSSAEICLSTRVKCCDSRTRKLCFCCQAFCAVRISSERDSNKPSTSARSAFSSCKICKSDISKLQKMRGGLSGRSEPPRSNWLRVSPTRATCHTQEESVAISKRTGGKDGVAGQPPVRVLFRSSGSHAKLKISGTDQMDVLPCLTAKHKADRRLI